MATTAVTVNRFLKLHHAAPITRLNQEFTACYNLLRLGGLTTTEIIVYTDEVEIFSRRLGIGEGEQEILQQVVNIYCNKFPVKVIPNNCNQKVSTLGTWSFTYFSYALDLQLLYTVSLPPVLQGLMNAIGLTEVTSTYAFTHYSPEDTEDCSNDVAKYLKAYPRLQLITPQEGQPSTYTYYHIIDNLLVAYNYDRFSGFELSVY